MELLAPAGSKEALIAAVQSGADAVYIGGSRFSARSSAKNFDKEEMQEMIDYCHIRGVMVHVAANTLIKEDEINSYLEYIGELNDMGVDAVIIQDIGMAKAVKALYPDLPIHASTQMTCASLNTAKKLEEAGFSRIVLARELDYESIRNIVNSVDAEIEVFVHGAICMSYSGQCLMSSMIGGRSGNRGMCAQPCRLPYKFLKNGKNVNKGYLLSPKDMCLVNHLDKLSEIGVTSLKIEGRLKRAEYVSAVVGVYRSCIDENRMATKEEYNELLDAFNRSGFTDGYFVNKKGKDMMSYENPSNISQNKFSEQAKRRSLPNNEFKKIPVKIKAELKLGKPLRILITDDKGNSVTAVGEIKAETALNRPLDVERLTQQLSKLGNTPFNIGTVQTDLDDGIVIPIGEINSVRRDAVGRLTEIRKNKEIRRKEKVLFHIETKEFEKPLLTAKVRNAEQARVCINKSIERIYAPIEVINEFSQYGDRFIAIMPVIDRFEKRTEFGKLLVSSIGQADDKTKKYYADYRFNVYNSLSIKALEAYECVTLSPELTINEIKNIKKPIDTELIVYGKIPLMTFENCPVKANSVCDKGKSVNELIDRMNERFTLMCCEGCFCELLNSKPIYMADKLDDIKNLGVKFLRLDFTTENEAECEKIIENYKKALDNGNADGLMENTFTRGHFYKKID